MAPFSLVTEISRNPAAMKPLFVHNEEVDLTYDKVLALFDVQWSLRGSNRRTAEGRTFTYFKDWLLSLEGMEGYKSIIIVQRVSPLSIIYRYI